MSVSKISGIKFLFLSSLVLAVLNESWRIDNEQSAVKAVTLKQFTEPNHWHTAAARDAYAHLDGQEEQQKQRNIKLAELRRRKAYKVQQIIAAEDRAKTRAEEHRRNALYIRKQADDEMLRRQVADKQKLQYEKQAFDTDRALAYTHQQTEQMRRKLKEQDAFRAVVKYRQEEHNCKNIDIASFNEEFSLFVVEEDFEGTKMYREERLTREKLQDIQTWFTDRKGKLPDQSEREWFEKNRAAFADPNGSMGSFGIVLRGRKLANDDEVAVKINFGAADDAAEKRMLTLIGGNDRFHSNNLMKVHAVFDVTDATNVNDPVSIHVFEELSGGEVYDFADKLTGKFEQAFNKPYTYKNWEDVVSFPPEVAKIILADALEGLKVLHKNDIMHRDIKLQNMMLEHAFGDVEFYSERGIRSNENFASQIVEKCWRMNGKQWNADCERTFIYDGSGVRKFPGIKIIDFGFASKISRPDGINCGTPSTMAPEIAKSFVSRSRPNSSGQVDLFAIAIDLFGRINRFHAKNLFNRGFIDFRSYGQLKVQYVDAFLNQNTAEVNSSLSVVLKGLLEESPKHRSTADYALQRLATRGRDVIARRREHQARQHEQARPHILTGRANRRHQALLAEYTGAKRQVRNQPAANRKCPKPRVSPRISPPASVVSGPQSSGSSDILRRAMALKEAQKRRMTRPQGLISPVRRADMAKHAARLQRARRARRS